MNTEPDLYGLYELMLRSRRFEEVVSTLWHQGKISGEMHMSMGEESIMAAIISQLHHDDSLALDHRATAPLLMRGIEPRLLLHEFLGLSDGLCGGKGGHMHLFSKEHLAASSGIVGASGPAAVGFGLAARLLRPGSLTVAFFGEGAMNQGMLLESLNLTVVWKLPIAFVCKDDHWAITTQSTDVTGGHLVDRAAGFGMSVTEIDGLNPESAWIKFHEMSKRIRQGEGPLFIHAKTIHLEGHFLGDPLLQTSRHPLVEITKMAGPLIKSTMKKKSVNVFKKTGPFKTILHKVSNARKDHSLTNDPLVIIREKLEKNKIRLLECEKRIELEMDQLLESTLKTLENQY